MAKKNDRKADSQARGRAAKLPKRVAGMKVPKTLRKSGASALKLMRNPLAAEIIASALVATAAALVGSRRMRGRAGKAARDATGAGRLGEAIADAAADVAERIRTGGEQHEAPQKRPAAKAKRSKAQRTSPRPATGLAH